MLKADLKMVNKILYIFYTYEGGKVTDEVSLICHLFEVCRFTPKT